MRSARGRSTTCWGRKSNREASARAPKRGLERDPARRKEGRGVPEGTAERALA